MFELFVPLAAVGEGLIEIILGSTYFRWALLLFIIVMIGSVISGLVDVAIMVAQYGLIVLVILGLLEFVAPGVLAAILDALPV